LIVCKTVSLAHVLTVLSKEDLGKTSEVNRKTSEVRRKTCIRLRKTARDKFYVASSDSRDQAQMASEPENPTVVVGGWIGASRIQSAATATAGDATNLCLTFVVKMLCYTGGGLSCSCKHSALALALILMAL